MAPTHSAYFPNVPGSSLEEKRGGFRHPEDSLPLLPAVFTSLISLLLFLSKIFFFLLLKIDEECKIDTPELVMSTTLGGVLLQENDQ